MKTAIGLTLLLPLFGAIFNLLVGRLLSRRVVLYTACGVIIASFVTTFLAVLLFSGPAVVELGSWFSLFNLNVPISVALDPLSLSLVLMITFVCGLIHLYSIGYMAQETDYVRYFVLLNLFVWAMLVLVLADNLLLLYLGWEGVGFCSYTLIGFWYKEEKNATAGRKAFIVTRIGDIGLGIAIVWMFKLFATLSITSINHMEHAAAGGVVTILGLLLLLGAMGKSAQAPLMVWLPDAMAGPTPVSAQIHAATMVTAGVYLLMRMFPLIGGSAVVCGAIAVTGVVTAFYGASCALAERDLKRILAYSTISQIGYMMLGVGCGAIAAVTFHLVIHAFFKALLFLGAGCIITALHHQQDIYQMGGVRHLLPRVFWTFLIAAFCLAGVPPTGGFFSKDGIMAAVWAAGGWYILLYLVGMFTIFLTAIYTFRMVFIVFGDRLPPTGSEPPRQRDSLSELPVIMTYTLIPLAVLALAGGLFNVPGYLGQGMFNSVLAPLDTMQEPVSHGSELALQAVAVLVAAAGFVVAWLIYGRRTAAVRSVRAERPPSGVAVFLRAGWYLDDLYHLLFVRPFKGLAAFFWQSVDEGIIDDNLDRLAVQFGRVGHYLSSWGGGRVSAYMLSLACGAALMIGWVAWEVL